MERLAGNIDKQEITNFSSLAEQWWDPSGPMKPLHWMNPVRLGFIKEQLQISGKNVLDVGCGAGLLSEALTSDGAKVTAIDGSKKAIAVAQRHAEQSKLNIDYLNSTIEALDNSYDQQFDLICCLEMLEHVPDPSSVIAQCQRLLKANGIAIFSTINRHPKAYLLAILGAEHILRWLPTGTHRYEKFIKPSELARWCRASDLRLVSSKGFSFMPLRKTFQLSNDLDVNYIVSVQKVSAS